MKKLASQKTELDIKSEELKKKSDAAVYQNFNAADAYIEQLTKEQRVAAANIFSIGSDVIGLSSFSYQQPKDANSDPIHPILAGHQGHNSSGTDY